MTSLYEQQDYLKTLITTIAEYEGDPATLADSFITLVLATNEFIIAKWAQRNRAPFGIERFILSITMLVANYLPDYYKLRDQYAAERTAKP